MRDFKGRPWRSRELEAHDAEKEAKGEICTYLGPRDEERWMSNAEWQ